MGDGGGGGGGRGMLMNVSVPASEWGTHGGRKATLGFEFPYVGNSWLGSLSSVEIFNNMVDTSGKIMWDTAGVPRSRYLGSAR